MQLKEKNSEGVIRSFNDVYYPIALQYLRLSLSLLRKLVNGIVVRLICSLSGKIRSEQHQPF